MPTDDENAILPGPASMHERLAQIAKLLGCKVEDFMNGGQVLQDLKLSSELLGLWMEIGNTDDRRLLLELARRLARR